MVIKVKMNRSKLNISPFMVSLQNDLVIPRYLAVHTPYRCQQPEPNKHKHFIGKLLVVRDVGQRNGVKNEKMETQKMMFMHIIIHPKQFCMNFILFVQDSLSLGGM